MTVLSISSAAASNLAPAWRSSVELPIAAAASASAASTSGVWPPRGEGGPPRGSAVPSPWESLLPAASGLELRWCTGSWQTRSRTWQGQGLEHVHVWRVTDAYALHPAATSTDRTCKYVNSSKYRSKRRWNIQIIYLACRAYATGMTSVYLSVCLTETLVDCDHTAQQ